MSEPDVQDEQEELPLPAEARVILGLGLDERVRLRPLGSRTLLLERREVGPALPPDCALVLWVDVQAFPLPEVLGWVHATGKSGLLSVQHADLSKWVYLHRGEVVFAASSERLDSLGYSLVRAGVITLEQLQEAQRGFHPRERFGKRLVECGHLTPRQLWDGLQVQVEEIVRSLLGHTEGSVHFWEGDVQPDNVVRLSLPTQRLIEEGMRWRDELHRLVAALSDPRVRIESVQSKRESVADPERPLFEALARESTFAALCRSLAIDPLTAARRVQLLRKAGAVQVARAGEDPDRTQRVRREDPIERLRAWIHDAVKLLGELVAPIVAAEGAAPIRDRFGAAIEEVAARFPGLLAGVRPGPRGVIDPEVLLERALQLPSGPGGEVREALLELVDYLEFELKNHPGIGDPDELLHAVEPLRARLLA